MNPLDSIFQNTNIIAYGSTNNSEDNTLTVAILLTRKSSFINDAILFLSTSDGETDIWFIKAYLLVICKNAHLYFSSSSISDSKLPTMFVDKFRIGYAEMQDHRV